MQRKLFIIMLCGCLSVALIHAQESPLKLTLASAIEQGIVHSTILKNATLERKKLLQQQREARSGLYPQVEAYSQLNYSYAIPRTVVPGEIFGQTDDLALEFGTTFDWTVGINLSQLIFDQSYFTSLKVTDELLNLEAIKRRQSEEDLTWQITQLYYACQSLQAQKGYLQTSVKTMDKLMEITRLQGETGMIRKVDVLRLQIDKNNLLTQLDQLRQELEQRKGMLKYLLGVSRETPIEITDSLRLEPAFLSTSTPVFHHRPELLLLDKQSAITSLNLSASKQAALPTVAGFAQHFYQGLRNEFDFFEGGEDKFFEAGILGLRVSVPIFDGFARKAQMEQHKVALLQLENSYQDTRAYLQNEYANTLTQYDISYEACLRQEKNLEIAKENYNVNMLGYREQVVPLAELLDAESAVTEAQMARQEVLLRFKIAELALRRLGGELLNR